MSEMFKGRAKYPEWEEWRAWHKHIAEVRKQECQPTDDYRRDHDLLDCDPTPYIETDIGRRVASAGLSWFFFCVIIVGLTIYFWLTSPATVDVIYK